MDLNDTGTFRVGQKQYAQGWRKTPTLPADES